MTEGSEVPLSPDLRTVISTDFKVSPDEIVTAGEWLGFHLSGSKVDRIDPASFLVKYASSEGDSELVVRRLIKAYSPDELKSLAAQKSGTQSPEYNVLTATSHRDVDIIVQTTDPLPISLEFGITMASLPQKLHHLRDKSNPQLVHIAMSKRTASNS